VERARDRGGQDLSHFDASMMLWLRINHLVGVSCSCFIIAIVAITLVRPFSAVSHRRHLEMNSQQRLATPPNAYYSSFHKKQYHIMRSSHTTTTSETNPRRRKSRISVSPPLDLHKLPPYIAIITEPDCCNTDERWNATLMTLHAAVSTRHVDLVSVRVSRTPTSMIHHHNNDNTHNSMSMTNKTDANRNSNNNNDDDTWEEIQFQSRYVRMVQQLCVWSHSNNTTDKLLFRLVVGSGPYMELGIRSGGAHGVHFKEAHRSLIPSVRQLYRTVVQSEYPHNNTATTISGYKNKELLVGTSTHSVASAVEAWDLYQPDYMLVGTCYATESHPEKVGLAIEGPALPAQVCYALDQRMKASCNPSATELYRKDRLPQRPILFAIGGMDASNCGAQVTPGYYSGQNETNVHHAVDGVAVIRAILPPNEPAHMIQSMYHEMVLGTRGESG
jgi:hypothetical protein